MLYFIYSAKIMARPVLVNDKGQPGFELWGAMMICCAVKENLFPLG